MQARRSFVAGAQFFEWSDEWWKNGCDTRLRTKCERQS